MEAEHWRQIEALFLAAQAHPPEKRAAFLAKACPEDPKVRAEVESLLAQSANSFLEGSPLSAVETLSPGVRLGNFEIVELLGRGGMGEVYRARDARLKRDVAVKVLPASVARDPERISRFEREARSVSALNHPNIIVVYDIGLDGHTYWIATELVAGQPLSELIRHGPLVARKAMAIAAQIADGLAAAHAGGIVHRDLKPANIMVARDDRVKILDFGLAKQRRASGDSTTLALKGELTGEGTVMGTAGYMSPEQVRGEEVDPRSDLFSFGLILYEMVSGKRAFAGDSSVEVMSAILKEEPPDLPATVPPDLERIVRRCLAKDRERRFQNAADLAFALGSLSVPPIAAPPAPTGKRYGWMKWTAIPVVALASIAFAFKLGSGAAPHPSGETPDGTFVRLTNDPGLTTSAAISRDGRLVAYASDRDSGSNLDIYVQQVDGGAPIRLTDDPADDDAPAFSPDGTQIAFRSERDGGGIYIIPALGGESRLFAPHGYRPRFSPDGRMLLYTTAYPGRVDGFRLFVAQFPGGASRQVAPGCRVFSKNVVWSPDSGRILFTADCGIGGFVYVSTPEGKPVASKVDFHTPLGNTLDFDQWLPGPSRVLFERPEMDTASIAVAPISADGTKAEGPVRRLTFGTGAETQASAADNGRLVFSAIRSDKHIWGLSIDANGHATSSPRPLSAGWRESFPALSRDGRALAFSSRSAGRWVLYYRDLASGRQRELAQQTNLFDAPGGPFFGPNDREVVFIRQISASTTTTAFYKMPVSGGIAERVSRDEKGWRGIWDWSPDGKTLLFFQQAGGFGRIYAMDLGDLTETSFLDDPEYKVWSARFSNDGRWVTFNAEKDYMSRIFAAPFRRGPVPRGEWISVSDGSWDDKPNFAPDDRAIFFASKRDGYSCIWCQRLGPDRNRTGSPFAVYHAHQRRRSLVNVGSDGFQMTVGLHLLAFDQEERTGNIWLLEPAKVDTR